MSRSIFLLSIALTLTSPLVLAEEMPSQQRLLVDHLDELIGGNRADDLRSTSTLRIRLSDEEKKGHHLRSPALHFNLNLKLGRIDEWQSEAQAWIQDRWNHLKEHGTPRPHSSELHAQKTKGQDEPHRTSKLSKDSYEDWHFSLQKHFSISHRPQFWIHTRARKDFEFDNTLNSFALEIGWGNEDLWESNLYFVTHSQIAESWSVSFSNNANWSVNHAQFLSQHGPAISYLIDASQALTLAANVSMRSEKDIYFAESYSTELSYHLAAWKNCLYFSLSPYIEFPKTQNFHGEPGASLSLEAVF